MQSFVSHSYLRRASRWKAATCSTDRIASCRSRPGLRRSGKRRDVEYRLYTGLRKCELRACPWRSSPRPCQSEVNCCRLARGTQIRRHAPRYRGEPSLMLGATVKSHWLSGASSLFRWMRGRTPRRLLSQSCFQATITITITSTSTGTITFSIPISFTITSHSHRPGLLLTEFLLVVRQVNMPLNESRLTAAGCSRLLSFTLDFCPATPEAVELSLDQERGPKIPCLHQVSKNIKKHLQEQGHLELNSPSPTLHLRSKLKRRRVFHQRRSQPWLCARGLGPRLVFSVSGVTLSLKGLKHYGSTGLCVLRLVGMDGWQ